MPESPSMDYRVVQIWWCCYIRILNCRGCIIKVKTKVGKRFSLSRKSTRRQNKSGGMHFFAERKEEAEPNVNHASGNRIYGQRFVTVNFNY